jgi:hypothetical protein
MCTTQGRRDFVKFGATVGTGLFLGCPGLSGCGDGDKHAATEKTAASTDQYARDFGKVAYCGMICRKCPIFLATRNNDHQVKAKVAETWSKFYENKVFKPEDVHCDGCKSNTGRLGYFCENTCDVRKCAINNRVASCAHCEQYVCETLAKYKEPETRKRLDDIRKTLETQCRTPKSSELITINSLKTMNLQFRT